MSKLCSDRVNQGERRRLLEVDLAVEFADLGIANQFVDVIEPRENKVFGLEILWYVGVFGLEVSVGMDCGDLEMKEV